MDIKEFIIAFEKMLMGILYKELTLYILIIIAVIIVIATILKISKTIKQKIKRDIKSRRHNF